jgi:hypothetical protein
MNPAVDLVFETFTAATVPKKCVSEFVTATD